MMSGFNINCIHTVGNTTNHYEHMYANSQEESTKYGRSPGRDSWPEMLGVGEASCEGGWAPNRRALLIYEHSASD